MLANAALRSLSCEVTEAGATQHSSSNCVFFGDSDTGFVVARAFQLDDYKARGFKNMFSLVIVSTDKLLLLNSFDFLATALNAIVARLQTAAKEVGRESMASSLQVYRGDELLASSSQMGLRSADSARASMLPKEFLRERHTSGHQQMREPRSLATLTNQSDVFTRLHK